MNLSKIFTVLLCLIFVLQVNLVSAGSSDDFLVIATPATLNVITNESTNVEETIATMHGYLVNDSGTICQYRFQYDINPGLPYAFSTVWTGTITAGTEFSQGTAFLTKGELYYFRAQCRNTTLPVGNGTELKFLTKPDNPTNFQAVRDGVVTQVNLTWTMGNGADKTVIVRKIGSYPADRSDGITVYNGTSDNYDDGAVISGTHYYYRAWSYCSEVDLYKYSDNYDEDSVVALAPATFDIKNIVVTDDTVVHLAINVDVENMGGILTDITISWVLTRDDTGIVLDSGSDTIAVGAHSLVTHSINPSTPYIGAVTITFTGDGASAIATFNTRAPPAGGGGGGVPGPEVPPEIPITVTIPLVPPVEIPCLLLIIPILIIIMIILFIIWKRKEEEEKKKKRRKKRAKRS